MDDQTRTIAALERVLLTVEAELTALHTGAAVDERALARRLQTDLTTVGTGPAVGAPPPPPPTIPFEASQTPPPPRPPAPVPPGPPPPPPTQPRPIGDPPSATSTIERLFRFGGIGLVVLAAVFFVSTAISRGWIGPTAQLSLATLVSLGMTGQSFRFSADRRPWRVTMAAGGAAGLLVSGVVGFLGLELLAIEPTIGWLAVAVLAFLGLARAHDSELLAALAAPATLISMFALAASADDRAVFPIAVGIGLTVAVGATTRAKRWFIARALGGAVGAFVITWGVGLASDQGALAVATAAALIGIGAVLVLAHQQVCEFDASEIRSLIEARIAAGFVPWAGAVTAIVVASETSVTTAGWTLVGIGLTAVLGLHLGGRHLPPTMRMLHQLGGVGTAVLGTLIVVDGPQLLLGLLLQAVVSGVLAHRSRAAEMIVLAGLLGGLVAVWAGVLTVAALTGPGFTIGELIATGATVAATGFAVWTVRNIDGLGSLWVGAWLGAMVWVAAAWQTVPQTQMWISLSWAAMAVVLFVSGPIWSGSAQSSQFRTAVNVGLATLAFTGAKLIFVDLVAVDVLWRAGLFLVVGAMFLRLAFVLPNLLDRTVPPEIASE